MSVSEDATITSKGQVTIPKKIRDKLDLKEGEEIEFVLEEDGEIRVRRKKPPMERLHEVQRKLLKHDVDLEKMRQKSKQAWSSHDESEELA